MTCRAACDRSVSAVGPPMHLSPDAHRQNLGTIAWQDRQALPTMFHCRDRFPKFKASPAGLSPGQLLGRRGTLRCSDVAMIAGPTTKRVLCLPTWPTGCGDLADWRRRGHGDLHQSTFDGVLPGFSYEHDG